MEFKKVHNCFVWVVRWSASEICFCTFKYRMLLREYGAARVGFERT